MENDRSIFLLPYSTKLGEIFSFGTTHKE